MLVAWGIVCLGVAFASGACPVGAWQPLAPVEGDESLADVCGRGDGAAAGAGRSLLQVARQVDRGAQIERGEHERASGLSASGRGSGGSEAAVKETAAWCSPTPSEQAAALGSGVLVVLFVGLGCGLARAARAHGGGGRPDRNATIDNCRFVCAVMICLGHYHLSTWKHESPSESIMHFYLIKPFGGVQTMCGISFVSGSLSRSHKSRSSLRSLFTLVFLPCVLYSLLLLPLLESLRSLSLAPWNAQDSLQSTLNAAPSVEWYLQSLVLWRLLLYSFTKMSEQLATPTWPWLVGLCVLTTLAQPYVPWPKVYSMANSIFFLPCFVVGFLFPLEALMAKVPASRVTRLMGLSLLTGWSLLMNSESFGAFYANLPLKMVNAVMKERGQCPSSLSWCEGFFRVLSGLTVFLIFLVAVCPREPLWFTQVEGGMYAYLLHPHTLLPVWWFLEHQYHFPMMTSMSGAFAECMLQYAVCFAITYVLGSAPVRTLFAPILQPKWLAELIIGKSVGAGQNQSQSQKDDHVQTRKDEPPQKS